MPKREGAYCKRETYEGCDVAEWFCHFVFFSLHQRLFDLGLKKQDKKAR